MAGPERCRPRENSQGWRGAGIRHLYEAAGALSGPLILYLLEELGMADLERSGFEIVGGFVVIFRQTTGQDF
jgi:hypothetical protein